MPLFPCPNPVQGDSEKVAGQSPLGHPADSTRRLDPTLPVLRSDSTLLVLPPDSTPSVLLELLPVLGFLAPLSCSWSPLALPGQSPGLRRSCRPSLKWQQSFPLRHCERHSPGVTRRSPGSIRQSPGLI